MDNLSAVDMISIPARVALGVYSAFLLFYFVPWNLKNIQTADEEEMEILEKYGKMDSHDEFSIVLTQLFAVFCIAVSLISVYKNSVVVCAPSKQFQNIYLYPLTVFTSIILAMLAHDKYNSIFFTHSNSIFLFAHPMLALVRGAIFYKLFFPKRKNGNKKLSSDKIDSLATTPVEVVSVTLIPQSMLSFAVETTQKIGFVFYWCVYALVAAVFYNELGKYIAQDHISVQSFMKFILV